MFVQMLLSECVEYSRKEHLLDLITLISGMKKCGNSYEVEWISHGSAGLLRPPRMNNKILQSSLAAMFFVTNASLDMTEEESKYTGVHCIACNYCSSGIEMETQRGAFMLWRTVSIPFRIVSPWYSHHLLCERKWSIVTGEDSYSFTEPEAILFLCQEWGYGNRKQG